MKCVQNFTQGALFETITVIVHKIKLAQAHNSPSTKPFTKIYGMNWSHADHEYSLQGKQD